MRVEEPEIQVLVHDSSPPRNLKEELLELIDPKNPDLLRKWGGAAGVAHKIHSSLDRGLPKNQKDLQWQLDLFGSNILPEPISYTFLQFVWEALHDQTLMVLMIAAAVETAIGIYSLVVGKGSEYLVAGGAIVIASKSFTVI